MRLTKYADDALSCHPGFWQKVQRCGLFLKNFCFKVPAYFSPLKFPEKEVDIFEQLMSIHFKDNTAARTVKQLIATFTRTLTGRLKDPTHT